MDDQHTGRGPITYPVAYSHKEESIVRIADAPRERGQRYSCVHCKQRMSAVVLVTRKTPHFRHTKPAEKCDPDDALHTYAIRMIQQAHSKAVERGDPYMLTRPCKSCLNLATEIDFADSWECAVEKSIAEHTRSDLAFTHADGRQIAVEVVVTHMMESETEAAYKNMGLPVAIIRPNWETVNELLDNLQIEDSRNFDIDICSSW